MFFFSLLTNRRKRIQPVVFFSFLLFFSYISKGFFFGAACIKEIARLLLPLARFSHPPLQAVIAKCIYSCWWLGPSSTSCFDSTTSHVEMQKEREKEGRYVVESGNSPSHYTGPLTFHAKRDYVNFTRRFFSLRLEALVGLQFCFS